MPLPRTVADAFGVLTVSLASVFTILSLLCILYAVYLRLRIHRRGFDHLGYFNGPWITRLALVLVAVWWVCGEVSRLTFLKGKGRLFTDLPWQEGICKFYIISNVGFAEPALFLILVTLLHASVRKDAGSAARGCRWNGKAVGYVFLYCLPMLLLQAVLVFVGPIISNEENSQGVRRLSKYFTSLVYYLSAPEGGRVAVAGGGLDDGGLRVVCTYPLFSIVLLGLFHSILVCYVAYVGYRVLSLVINKRLQHRIYLLVLSALTFLPLRVVLLGFSVLPQPGTLAFEALVFLAFLALLVFGTAAVCILVYFPVADALALKGFTRLVAADEDLLPFDDYYSGVSSLIVNQSHLGTGTATESDDVSTMAPGSISFRTMIKDDALISSVVEGCEPFFFSPPNFPSASISPSGSPFHGVPLPPGS